MRKREIFLLSALTFYAGVAVGFLIAPAKNGFGNTTIHKHYPSKSLTDKEA